MMLKRSVCSLLLVLAVLLAYGVGIASASPHPGWQVMGSFSPTNLSPGGEGILNLYYLDVGAAGGQATIVDTLPRGVTSTDPACSSIEPQTCTFHVASESLASLGRAQAIGLNVHISLTASGEAVDEASITGPGALSTDRASIPARFSSQPTPFGLAALGAFASNEDGTIDTQAGSQPYSFTVAFAMNTGLEKGGEEYPAGGELRHLDVKLPPGLVGDAQAAPKCPRAQFDPQNFSSGGAEEICPADTVIGYDTSITSPGDYFNIDTPIINVVPPAGVAAEFAFTFRPGVAAFIDAKVRSGGDYGITAHTDNIPQRQILFNSTTIWGTPASHYHDLERRSAQLEEGCVPEPEGGCGSDTPAKPFLLLPTSCGAPPVFTAEALGAWQNPNATSSMTVPMTGSEGNTTGFGGCEKLVHFEPFAEISPDTSLADTPAGLTANVQVPLEVNPEHLSTSGVKNTTVVLPQGVVINPGQATGLVACQPSEENIGGESEAFDGPPSCPSASKVGTDEISTPLVPDKLTGDVYILGDNPPHLKLLVAASGDGVYLKLIGEVNLNETTGQLTTTFKETPDVPFTDFKLSFSGGAQAALATPVRCGEYSSSADFTPWSTPFVQNALSTSSFVIDAGSNNTSCAWPLPFAPTMTAGATTDQAGGYTDFTMLLQRGDGQQRIEKLRFETPEGLLGMISKVQLCQEPQAATGECSEASQIGHTVATAGPGPYPFQVPQAGAPPAPIYLTGPYDGAPFGLSIKVPLIAGPFNLGTEVVRAKVEVDPHTSRLTITTTGFPITVKGIPTDIRAIDAVIDRPNFMFNPTDCAPMSFSGTATSTEGTTAALGSHFQMGSCQALKFQPNFKVSTNGKTSRANGASLTAKIVYPTGNLGFNQASSQSNIASVKVDLPKQLPSRLTTLQKACPAATFEANPANCPAASIVGHAKAITPVLPVPIEGPAYFVSHAGEEFPSLIAVLQGYGVTVDLVGSTFINGKTNVTSSTFKNVPDVPIASFELTLPQGKYSALAANGNLCKTKLKMPTAFTGQNGAQIHQTTPIAVTGCAKSKIKKKTKKSSKHGARGKSKKK
jgi:hypothetical protein